MYNVAVCATPLLSFTTTDCGAAWILLQGWTGIPSFPLEPWVAWLESRPSRCGGAVMYGTAQRQLESRTRVTG